MKSTCLVPSFDFDAITMGHGGGGLLTQRLLQSGVFAVLGNDLLNQQHDGASFSLEGKLAFSTDSYVVSPLFFPGGNIGDLAVNGTVNDLAMCGASARYLSLAFIIEEGLKMDQFAAVLQSIAQAAKAAGVQIVTGDTKVVERGKGDQLFINTSGIGIVHRNASIHHQHIRPGDKIILSGKLAAHGIAIMSKRKGLSFETDIVSDTTALNHTVINLIETYGSGIRFLRDPTRGGLASVLNEVAGLTKLGYTLDQKAIPIDAQVEGACEMLGLDPLYVANEGIFAAIVSREIAPDFLRTLHQHYNGEHAAIIGEVSAEHPGTVVAKGIAGGHRIISYLAGEQLPRIC
jgi:hydrogenase expression/formation protein HypE